MSNLIPVNYGDERQTVNGRLLHEFLEVDTPYTMWIKRMVEYGFTEGTDFITLLLESTGGRPSEDHQITIDMAKEISMLQRTEKGKQARQYFIELEKRWNSPEALMARALRMADNKILSLQSSVDVLQTENKLLAQETLTWANRKVIEAIIKKIGGKTGYEIAWREFKKELLYAHGINLNSRITHWRNTTGRKTGPKTLDMIEDDELQPCLATATALSRNHKIDITEIIQKFEQSA